MSILFPYTLTGTIGALQWPKTDAVPIPQGATISQYLSSSDWNQAMGALTETALAITSGSLFGFQRQVASPTGSAGPNQNLTDYIWVNSNGDLMQHLSSGVDRFLSGSISLASLGATLSASYAAGAAATDNILILNSTGGPVTLKDAASSIGNLFAIQNRAATFTYFLISTTQPQLIKSAVVDGATATGSMVSTTALWSNVNAKLLDVQNNGDSRWNVNPYGSTIQKQVDASAGAPLFDSPNLTLRASAWNATLSRPDYFDGRISVNETALGAGNLIFAVSGSNWLGLNQLGTLFPVNSGTQLIGSPSLPWLSIYSTNAYARFVDNIFGGTLALGGTTAISVDVGRQTPASTTRFLSFATIVNPSGVPGNYLQCYSASFFIDAVPAGVSSSNNTPPISMRAQYNPGGGSNQYTISMQAVMDNIQGTAAHLAFVLGGQTFLNLNNAGTLYAGLSGSQVIGSTSVPWQNIVGITGSFQLIDTPTTNQTLLIGSILTNGIQIGRPNINVVPGGSGSVVLGTVGNPWSNTVSITGSFQLIDTPNTNQNLRIGGTNNTFITLATAASNGWVINSGGSLTPNTSGSFQVGSVGSIVSNFVGISGSFQTIDTPTTNQNLFIGLNNAVQTSLGTNPNNTINYIGQSGSITYFGAPGGITPGSQAAGSVRSYNPIYINNQQATSAIQLRDSSFLYLQGSYFANGNVTGTFVGLKHTIDSSGSAGVGPLSHLSFGLGSPSPIELMLMDQSGTLRPANSGSQLLGITAAPWGNIISISGSFQTIDTPTTNQSLILSPKNATNVFVGYNGTAFSPKLQNIAMYVAAGNATSSFLVGPANIVMTEPSGAFVNVGFNGGNTLSLGTAGTSFYLDISSNIQVTGTLLPGLSGSTYSLGSLAFPWKNVQALTGTFQTIDSGGGGAGGLMIFSAQGVGKWVMEPNAGGAWRPFGSGSQTVGVSSSPVGTVFTVTGSSALDQAIHFKGLGAAPSGSLGSGAGTAGSYTFSGSDSAHLLTVAVGTSPTPGTALITGTFNQPYGVAPNGINLEPANAAAAQAMSGVYVDSNSVFALTGSAYVIKTVGAALTPSTTFKFWVSVIA